VAKGRIATVACAGGCGRHITGAVEAPEFCSYCNDLVGRLRSDIAELEERNARLLSSFKVVEQLSQANETQRTEIKRLREIELKYQDLSR
jgi:SMC interacting uncharacterized protein involved in chromosome segregation